MNILKIRNWQKLLHRCRADSVGALTKRQHFSAWNDLMAAISKYDIISPIRFRQSIRIYFENIPAKFHPEPIWHDIALGLFWRGLPDKKKKNNKMSSNMRSGRDLKICTLLIGYWCCNCNPCRFYLTDTVHHFILIPMISSGNFGRTSHSTIRSMVLTSRDHCMMRTRRRGTSTASAQFLTKSRTRLAFASREWTRRTCTLGCGRHCFRGTRRTWTCTVLTTFITERQSRGMRCRRSMAVGWSV